MKYNEHYTNDREALALLTYLVEPRDKEMVSLVWQFGPQLALDIAFSGKNVSTYEKLTARLEARLPNQEMGEFLHQREVWDGIYFITRESSEWPVYLHDMAQDQPLGLWYRGDLDMTFPIAIVGARACTSYGEHITREIANDLVAKGHTIVSGAAYGIDGAAHQAALAAGGKTVAFLAGGVDSPYPNGHRDLIGRIAQAGAVVSEVPPRLTPTTHRFLARNRLIAGVSRGLVVVEAGFRSGSRAAANEAETIGRPVMAVPGPVTSPASAGTNQLIREGAILVTSAADIGEAVNA